MLVFASQNRFHWDEWLNFFARRVSRLATRGDKNIADFMLKKNGNLESIGRAARFEKDSQELRA